MKRSLTIPILVCGILLAVFLTPGLTAQPALAGNPPRPNFQSFDAYKCRLFLEKSASRLDWAEPEIYVNDYGDGTVSCQMGIIDRSGVPVVYDIFVTYSPAAKSWCDNCDYYCDTPGNENRCTCIDVHGMIGRQSELTDNTGVTLEFCDQYCSLIFKVMTRTDDGHFVDPRPLADALYYSALELNCCQAVEGIPPQDNPPNPESPLLPLPGDQSGSSSPGPDSAAKNPLLPFAGALFGTLLGWLVSVATTSWDTLRTIFTALVNSVPTASGVPSPSDLPANWADWERQYKPGQPPKPLAEPSLQELHSVDISAEDAKSGVLQYFSREIQPENRMRVENAQIEKLETADFVAKYLKIIGKDEDIDFASAFVNPVSGEITICQPRAVNYTPVHELIHVASNPTFGTSTNKSFDEAVTEYFTLKIASQDGVPRMTEYQLNGSIAIVEEIVATHGEILLRKAYFGPDDKGLIELEQAVDQKLGPGAFKKVIEIMGRVKTKEQLALDPTNDKKKALDLLRSRGIRK